MEPSLLRCALDEWTNQAATAGAGSAAALLKAAVVVPPPRDAPAAALAADAEAKPSDEKALTEGMPQPAKRLRAAAPTNALVASNLPPVVAPPRALSTGSSRANRLGSLYHPLNRHTPKPAWYVQALPAAKRAASAAAEDNAPPA